MEKDFVLSKTDLTVKHRFNIYQPKNYRSIPPYSSAKVSISPFIRFLFFSLRGRLVKKKKSK